MRSRNRPLPVVIPNPDRIRSISRGPFGWLDARLHTKGWIELLSGEALSVYTFLCLVANRQGVSWYRDETIRTVLGLTGERYREAERRLMDLDLIAYLPFYQGSPDGYRQVLSMPEGEASWEAFAQGPDDKGEDE